MEAVDNRTTTRSTRLERLIRLYETGQASDFMDRVLDKVFAQEAAEELKLIEQLRSDLNEFEERYEIDSQSFYTRFRSGELGDAMDYMEWASLFDMYQQAKARLALLTE
jgi:uncharacterized protein YaaN involved in tellurite resistance